MPIHQLSTDDLISVRIPFLVIGEQEVPKHCPGGTHWMVLVLICNLGRQIGLLARTNQNKDRRLDGIQVGGDR